MTFPLNSFTLTELLCHNMAFGISDSVEEELNLIAEEIFLASIPEDKNIDPGSVEQVNRSSRYVRCKGLGRFGKHHDPEGRVCKKSWKSVRAWCTIDLKKQCIAHRWSQKCKLCKGDSKPWFDKEDKEALQKMVEHATNSHRSHRPGHHTGSKQTARKTGESLFGDYPQIKGPPRYEIRCVECRKLGRSCWKNAKHVYDDQEWLITEAGSLDNSIDGYLNEFEDEYDEDKYYEDEYYHYMFEDDDGPCYITCSESDYDYTPDSDQFSLYDPYDDDYRDGDLYNCYGEPYDLWPRMW